jgi:hypothetical protein
MFVTLQYSLFIFPFLLEIVKIKMYKIIVVPVATALFLGVVSYITLQTP